MIPAHETTDAVPLCPHCEAPQRSLLARAVHSTFGRRYVYFCAACKKVLGVSHRKGFWMG